MGIWLPQYGGLIALKESYDVQRRRSIKDGDFDLVSGTEDEFYRVEGRLKKDIVVYTV